MSVLRALYAALVAPVPVREVTPASITYYGPAARRARQKRHV